MSTYTRRPHPSERLQNNDVKGFSDAMSVYMQQMRHENDLTKRLAAESNQPITDDERACINRLAGYASQASDAQMIFARHYGEAVKATVAELRAKNDELFNDFADALESDDYSRLAI